MIWFCPLDPIFRTEVGYGGSPTYMKLFSANAPWRKAAARIDVFKIYPQWILQARDSDLRTQFADLDRRGIALALEYGVLSESAQCGKGVEGFGGKSLLNAARRIRQNGGKLQYIAMDEPVYFSTVYSGSNACQWTLNQMAENAAENIMALLAEFPNVAIGEIEPVPICFPDWLSHYQSGICAFRKALGFAPAFFHADVNWIGTNLVFDLSSLSAMLQKEGVRFGIIYNGNGADSSSKSWVQSARQHMEKVELSARLEHDAIFQSWNRFPRKLLPERDSDSFTWLITRFSRARTELKLSLTGNTMSGRLSSRVGGAIGRARISVMGAPVSGSGRPGCYFYGGSTPVGATSIVFGARVNLGCLFSGHAEFWLSSFTYRSKGGRTLKRDFSDELNGWGLCLGGSPPPTARVKEGRLYMLVQPGQVAMLNSPPLKITRSGQFEFEVRAQVAPGSTGSGYFVLIFLGPDNKEISRILVLLQSAPFPIGLTTTNAEGLWMIKLPLNAERSIGLEADYAGSSTYWPARRLLNLKPVHPATLWPPEQLTSDPLLSLPQGNLVVLFQRELYEKQPARHGAAVPWSTRAETRLLFDGLPALFISRDRNRKTNIVACDSAVEAGAGVRPNTTAKVGTTPILLIASKVPGLLTFDPSTDGLVAAVNEDGGVHGILSPANPGALVRLFGAGIWPAEDQSVLSVQVTIGGVPARTESMTTVGGDITGVFQLDVRIPEGVPTGDSIPTALTIRGSQSPALRTMAIRLAGKQNS